MPATTRTGDGGDPFALKYGALQSVLTGLLGGRGDAIVTRFRKLRPKFAADGLLTETGNRVRYDLTRVLAVCAIYEINALSVPQGHAVDIVVANWPEIARACLAAWRGAPEGSAADPKSSPVVRFYIDALNEEPGKASWASLGPDASARIPHVTLDCGPAVDAVRAAAEALGCVPGLTAAFDELDGTFGWDEVGEGDPLRLPRRKESDFFGTGPYFDRARALLEVDPEEKVDRRRAVRLQTTLDYLEKPAPIDSWKRYIGTDAASPRLVHLLGAWGKGLGLTSQVTGPSDVLQAAWSDRDAAIALIERGELRAAELAAGDTD